MTYVIRILHITGIYRGIRTTYQSISISVTAHTVTIKELLSKPDPTAILTYSMFVTQKETSDAALY